MTEGVTGRGAELLRETDLLRGQGVRKGALAAGMGLDDALEATVDAFVEPRVGPRAAGAPTPLKK